MLQVLKRNAVRQKLTINGFKSKAEALRYLRAAGFNVCTILGRPESNPKIAKNGHIVEVMTGGTHLAPFDLSGFQVCPMASNGCAKACLHTAGNPAHMDHKEKSRIIKTQAYFKERKAFLAVLIFEMIAHRRRWLAQGYEVGFRLNATSDLPWERIRVNIDGKDWLIMDYFKDCQFYDYTAIPKRAIGWAKGQMPSNYHLTFSRKEDNDKACLDVMEAGGNVAVCMEKPLWKKSIDSGFIQLFGEAWRVTNGDAHDYRPNDPIGCVVALSAKGDAKRDQSGFTLRQ